MRPENFFDKAKKHWLGSFSISMLYGGWVFVLFSLASVQGSLQFFSDLPILDVCGVFLSAAAIMHENNDYII